MTTHDIGSAARSDPGYAWDFCGGQRAIDFTNTVGSRAAEPEDEEHFSTFGDVVAWGEAAGLIGRAGALRLQRFAEDDPAGARREFRRALELREALYRVLAARARGRAPRGEELAAFNRFVHDVFGRAALAVAGGQLELATPAGQGLDAVLTPVVREAVDLLTAVPAPRIGTCADQTCAWLFVDTTRSGTRRWCDMKICGNRNKVRRFRGSV